MNRTASAGGLAVRFLVCGALGDFCDDDGIANGALLTADELRRTADELRTNYGFMLSRTAGSRGARGEQN